MDPTIRPRVAEAVVAALRDYNADAAPERQVEVDLGTVLVGPGGRLDSLGLVNFIVRLEEQLTARINVELSIADALVSSAGAPFHTVATTVDFLTGLVAERGRDEG